MGVLQLARPRELPNKAPRGRDARDLHSYDSFVEHPGHACTPQAILAAYRLAESGFPQRQCDLFDDLIEADGHLRNLFEQRRQAVAGKPWVIQVGDQGELAQESANVLRTAMSRLSIVDVIEHLLTYNFHGWACVEIDWDVMRINGRDWVVPVWFAPVPARRFRIATQSWNLEPGVELDSLRLYTDSAKPNGEELKAGKWIVLRRLGSLVARAGLMRTAAWPSMAKRYGFRDWIIYSEKYGLPLPLAKYKAEADDEAKDVAQQIVENIGNDGGAVIPDTIDVEFKEVGNSGDSSKVHGGLISFCNRENSKLVNGSTLANDNSDSGGASYALGEVHDSVRWEAVQYDAEKLQSAFTQQVFAPFCKFNGIPIAPPEMKIQVVRDLNPRQRAEIGIMLKNELGMDISLAQLRTELGYREPTDAKDSAPGMPTPIAPTGVAA